MPKKIELKLEAPQSSQTPKIMSRAGNQWVVGIAVVGNVIFTLAVPIVIFTLLGRYLDRRWEYDFLFIIVGGIVGIAVGIYGVWCQANDIKLKIFGPSQTEPQTKK